MTRISLSVLAGAALLLGGCTGDGGRSAAAASDSGAAPVATEAPVPAPPPAVAGGIGGVPAYARQGVDSSNAAQQQRLDQVNELSDQATGSARP
jgi:hypothetical protein